MKMVLGPFSLLSTLIGVDSPFHQIKEESKIRIKYQILKLIMFLFNIISSL